jgi:KUP system potassium uptake protein
MNKSTQPMRLLMLGALGVVFGDIGTSPLYTLKACLTGLAINSNNVMGVLSMIAWAIMIVVTLKYVFFVMKADNNGEGGILSLMALVSKSGPPQIASALVLIGLFGAAMFYGDSMITPAISVLSAIEGTELINPAMSHWTVIISVCILLLLFMAQKQGTSKIGTYFGPIMLLWFAIIAVMGTAHIISNLSILKALSPLYAIKFAVHSPGTSFVVLASVFLAVTGGEALYADMGHFGKRPIRRVWLLCVFPALLLCYFGQGAMVLGNPKLLDNPFFNLAPSWALIPLIVLSGAATIIASQAVISGAFSMTKAGIQLGYLPHLTIVHTSSKEIGQIYVPAINSVLMIAVILLTVGFGTSDSLSNAYGIAVASTMMLTTVFMLLVTRYIWKWSLFKSLILTSLLLCVDAVFVAANLEKVLQGGWFPLVAGAAIFTIMITWKRGKTLVSESATREPLRLKDFVPNLWSDSTLFNTVEGTAVFLNDTTDLVPTAFLHNLKHNKVVHDTNVFLSIETQNVPYVRNSEKIVVEDLGWNSYQVTAKLGFKELPNVPRLLQLVQGQICSWNYEESSTSFFLTREALAVNSESGGMLYWRKKLFIVLARNATKAAEYFNIPANRVIELGGMIKL